MKEKFKIHSTQGDSKIFVEKDVLSKLQSYILQYHKGKRLIILTDTNLASIFKKQLEIHFPQEKQIVVKAGDASKSIGNVEEICSKMLNDGLSRDTVMIGFGGGVVTDLAGFIASIYMRGIAYIAVPTSFLAMIDASVGGKTGVNLKAKNIIGTFYLAESIFVDLDFLKTLPKREFQIGIAEAIKYASVLDVDLEEILMGETPNLPQILEHSLRAKVNICNQDLKEGGVRKVLNYGHTLGHAIEQLSNYQLSHGEAISIGMVLANQIAQKIGKQSKETASRIEAMIKKYDLPTQIPNYIKIEDAIEMIAKDKKMQQSKVDFILATELGKYEIHPFSLQELRDLLLN